MLHPGKRSLITHLKVMQNY